MKKALTTSICAALLTISLSTPALAGQWITDVNGRWWQRDDGSYPANGWEWIDSDNDGAAECYYFNESGYCAVNTITPDGYTVNTDGAWTVDGAVQTKQLTAQAGTDIQTANMDGYYYPAMLTVTTTGETEIHDYNEFILGNIVFQALADGNIMTTYPNNEIDGIPSYILVKTGENTYLRSDELGRPMVLTIIDSQTFTLSESDGLFLYTYKKR